MIKIPRRRFLGVSPELEGSVNEIVSHTLKEYAQGWVDDLKNIER